MIKAEAEAAIVQDVVVGNCTAPGGGQIVSRMAGLAAGFPIQSTLMTVNRQCSSGLQACASIAAAIKAGQIDCGVAAGVESMTLHYGPAAMPMGVSDKVMEGEAKDGLTPMGITSDTVAQRFDISRKDQDEYSALSHQKAERAQKEGYFDKEIVPMTAIWTDPKSGDEKQVRAERDDGVRANVSPAAMAKLRPAFNEDGTTTAGNSSQVTDGAAAVLMMRRSFADRYFGAKLGRVPGHLVAQFHSFTVAGVPPGIMGVGPAYAIPRLLTNAGIRDPNDIDIYEINEAFASQFLYCCRELKINMEKVNPKGGAIALGHPLGCTGARQVATLLTELERTDKRTGVISMCIGSGMYGACVAPNGLKGQN